MSCATMEVTYIARVIARFGSTVALLRQPADSFWCGVLLPPGGHVEHGETAKEAAARELQEELGWRIPVEQFRLLAQFERRDDDRHRAIVTVFEVELQEIPPQRGEESHLLEWVPFPVPSGTVIAHPFDDIIRGLYV